MSLENSRPNWGLYSVMLDAYTYTGSRIIPTA